MKKKALSLAIGAGLLATSMAASAEPLLFPYFISGSGEYTFITLRADDAAANLHYVWSYDDPTWGECTHFDLSGSMSAADLIQQTVVSPSSPGGVDIEDFYADTNVSNPQYLPLTVGTEGFLQVNHDAAAEAEFSGQAIVVDVNAGTVSAYRGLNNIASTAEGDFSSIFVSAMSNDYTWYPTDLVDTSWFVLATGTNMHLGGGWFGELDLYNGFDGIYDRDERFASGSIVNNVVCYRTLTLADMLTTAQMVHAQNGGWMWKVNVPVSGGATGALVYKFETTNALGTSKTAISEENPFPNI